MLVSFLTFLFSFCCMLLILLILVQPGKNSMGLGAMGGGQQMLFGGSGGQDIFQKATWILGVIFMAGSLILALLKTREIEQSRYIERSRYVLPQELPTDTDQ